MRKYELVLREEYSMQKSNSIWQWHRDGMKLILTKRKIHSMVDGHSSLAKYRIISQGNKCIDYSPINKHSTTNEGEALKSRAYLRKMCVLVQNSIVEDSLGFDKNQD